MDLFRFFHEQYSKRGSIPRLFLIIDPSLTTSIYIILVNVLVGRPKIVFQNTIAPNQSTFVHRRHITHPIIIANEIVDCWGCNKQKSTVELDIEKVLDNIINWDFLLSILYFVHSKAKSGQMNSPMIFKCDQR